ncbi:MAG: hypothetical protein AAGD32_06650 [Planctomycetota bacterium]
MAVVGLDGSAAVLTTMTDSDERAERLREAGRMIDAAELPAHVHALLAFVACDAAWLNEACEYFLTNVGDVQLDRAQVGRMASIMEMVAVDLAQAADRARVNRAALESMMTATDTSH